MRRPERIGQSMPFVRDGAGAIGFLYNFLRFCEEVCLSSYLSNLVLFLFLTIGTSTTRLGIDLDGNPVQALALPDTRVVVLFFAASDCPISNRYVPEITRLQKAFSPRHVAFWWVFPNPGETAALLRDHQRQFSIHGGTIIDSGQTLVRLAHVTTTPESAVFTVNQGNLNEVYHGRVDDRYLSIGQERPQATQHDLEDAVAAAVAGRPVSHSVTHAVGCSIVPLAAAR